MYGNVNLTYGKFALIVLNVNFLRVVSVHRFKMSYKFSYSWDGHGLTVSTRSVSFIKFILYEHVFLRWAFNDDNLPSWFVEDEGKHYQRQIPVSKEIVADYKARMKEINSRTVKKVAEAKARKKRKVKRRCTAFGLVFPPQLTLPSRPSVFPP